ncbi:MAG: NAD-dependent epimerase/dehydratase family protein [Variovorax sp.]|nr:MAG: NAD-dependent epimerase/dehydratase family protein [Variovorax sp.]
MNVTVMGATGHTGSKITPLLLESGARVRALGRNANKLSLLESAGAEVRAGDACDPAFLTQAFRGADAVYTLLATDRQAPDYAVRQQQEGEAIAQAVRESGVRHVVTLSSLGAELPAGTGVIAGLHAQEERLQRLPSAPHLLFLRPVSFFENFLEMLPLMLETGVHADSVLPDLAMPMVAAADIAEAAAQALLARDWQGVAVRELLGPRDMSHAEVTRILAEHLRRPDLRYVQIPDAEMAQALVEGGLSGSFAGLYVEMTRAFNANRLQPREGRNAANTTRTRFEDFVAEAIPAPR